MYARCLFPILLLILIAGRNLIVSDYRLYPTSRRLTKFEQLNRRTRDIHTRRKMTKRSRRRARRVASNLEEEREESEASEETSEFWTSW
ncbi:hypothetical protein V1264_019786 [Littorina saxatilis]|uniref:Uncharacterized protein n=1 Tax=Littorina saxatilis TaxID=31220 RepID=A0AAN9BA36_9CAEN